MSRITVQLTETQREQWKSTGLTASEVFTRGLNTTADTARHLATEQRLALVEARLAMLESRLATSPAEQVSFDEDELDRERERHHRTRIGEWAAQIATFARENHLGQITTGDAQDAFQCSALTAKSRMRELVSNGHATETQGTGPGRPRIWHLADRRADNRAE